jgi:threonylcarbamoyladenosine tRNA methylthiotransferase MtaB
VNFIIRNKDKYNIPKIIAGDRHACPLPAITGFKGHARAFVKVQDGCNNRCSYCKVSIVRGGSRSKPFEDVIKECAILIKNRYREIVLTGVCLGAYGRDILNGLDLPELIMELCKIKGDWRIRLSSIEPGDITDGLIGLMASEEKMCKHLHIPFQSGDNEILKRMNRPYSVRDYTGIVTRLRKAIPDIAISTDIMAGFPGEKESNFQNTMSFIKEIRPMRLHVFGFSRRTGTIAYSYKDNVSMALKKQREHALIDIVKGFTADFENMFIGKIARVLVEDRRAENGFLQGYTDRYIKVLIDGPDAIKSSITNCRLTSTPPKETAGAGLTNQKVYGILLLYSD